MTYTMKIVEGFSHKMIYDTDIICDTFLEAKALAKVSLQHDLGTDNIRFDFVYDGVYRVFMGASPIGRISLRLIK